MIKRSSIYLLWLCLMCVFIPSVSNAQANLEVNTPAITNIKQRMQNRHVQLIEYYKSGAIGLTQEGLIMVHDAGAVPLAKRQQVNTLVSAENQDRNALYREIARANKRPEWEPKIRSTFGQRWISLAQTGWWYQHNGQWQQK